LEYWQRAEISILDDSSLPSLCVYYSLFICKARFDGTSQLRNLAVREKKQKTWNKDKIARVEAIRKFWANNNVMAVNQLIFDGFREADSTIQVRILRLRMTIPKSNYMS
jgi:hypothetical protein